MRRLPKKCYPEWKIAWQKHPNGFSWYNGEYHLFYQYNPYDTQWGPMHWGHAVSSDLLHWKYLPAALAPDEACDRDGCFSGSAVTLPDGRQLLMYTGVVRERLANGGSGEVQTQCLAVGNGVDYEKYEKNPVLDERDIPEGGSRYDFRDPKMWQEEDGSYRCVVGNRAADGSGQILLFSSRDGFVWHYDRVLTASRNRFGRMWECPDFFPLDGKWVLVVSPQDMLPSGFEYHNGNGTLCLIGDYDKGTGEFTEVSTQGRFGQLSLPRELFIRNGRLCQRPVRELDSLRTARVSYENVTVSGTVRLEGIRGRRIDMELDIRPAGGCDLYRKFAVRFAQNELYHTSLSFRPGESLLKVDRKFSGSRKAIIHQRRSMVNHQGGRLKLRVILDRFSVEAFVNDGEQVLTAVRYTDQEADGISFIADGTVSMDVTKYDLVSLE